MHYAVCCPSIMPCKYESLETVTVHTKPVSPPGLGWRNVRALCLQIGWLCRHCGCSLLTSSNLLFVIPRYVSLYLQVTTPACMDTLQRDSVTLVPFVTSPPSQYLILSVTQSQVWTVFAALCQSIKQSDTISTSRMSMSAKSG